MYKRAKLYKRNSDWLQYKDLQHKEHQMLKHKHRAYITNIISSSNNNKLFWKYMWHQFIKKKTKQIPKTNVQYHYFSNLQNYGAHHC